MQGVGSRETSVCPERVSQAKANAETLKVGGGERGTVICVV